MPHGEHHQHKRKTSAETERLKRIKILDDICYVFAVLMPLTTLPQIWKIYTDKTAAGISLLMWILYFITVIPWLIYGVVHKAKPIIVLNGLWLTVQIIIIAGVIIYR